MKNLKSYDNFLMEAEQELPASLEFRKAQKAHEEKIAELTSKLKAAMDDTKTPEREVNILKLELRAAKLRAELDLIEYKLENASDKESAD